MSLILTRRRLIASAVAVGISPGALRARQLNGSEGWSLPLRNPGGIPGDGFLIRHGYASENTWFSPGNWHTAEDWYRDGDVETAGAEVLAVHEGTVEWIGSDYPGRVILVLHDSGLYSMYGHLDYAVDVIEGERVSAGQVLGRVLAAVNWRAPSHLHFEMRDFFLNRIVNGDSPRYGFQCGYQCPPGPGYWPMQDPRHPSEVGWRNPTHVVHQGFASSGSLPDVVVATGADGRSGPVRSGPIHDASGVREITLRAGDRFPVIGMKVGSPRTARTSAHAYRVWFQVRLGDGTTGWLPGVVPDERDTGSDGRPSSLRRILLPVGA